MAINTAWQKAKQIAFYRFFELFLIVNYVSWLLVFIDNPDFMAGRGPVYFEWPPWVYRAVLTFLAGASVLCLGRSPRARFFAGYLMELGAIIWCQLAIKFWQAYPPLSASMITYSALSLFAAVLGTFLIESNRPSKVRTDATKGGCDANQ